MRLSYANVVSTLALVAALAGGGTAVAAGLARNSVGTAQLKKGAVTAAKVRPNSIGGQQVKNGSLGGADIANRSLGGIDVADGSLGGLQIADHSLGGVDIADGSLGGAQIADDSLTSADIADGTVSSADIADHTITDQDLSPSGIGIDAISGDAQVQISRVWSTNPITAGGFSGFGVLDFAAAAAGQQHTVAVAFPMSVPAIPAAHPIGATGCTGTFANPSAPAGDLCVYVDPSTTNVAVGDPVASDSARGFLLTQTAPAAGESTAQFTWAYSVPSS